MTPATITYQLVSGPVRDLDEAPVRGVALPDGVAFGLTERDLPLLPRLRAWLAQQSAQIISESGTRAPTRRVQSGRRYLLASPHSIGAEVIGVTQIRTACPTCGLPIRTVEVDPGARVHHRLPCDRLVSVMGACWVMRDSLIRALEDGDSAVGLCRAPVTFDDGDAWAALPERRLSGLAYPFGPEPCATCGRASRDVGGRIEFVPPLYSLGPAMASPDAQPGWWWHELYGQPLPIVDGDVARTLRELVPDIGAFPVVRPDDPDAFLPEELR